MNEWEWVALYILGLAGLASVAYALYRLGAHLERRRILRHARAVEKVYASQARAVPGGEASTPLWNRLQGGSEGVRQIVDFIASGAHGAPPHAWVPTDAAMCPTGIPQGTPVVIGYVVCNTGDSIVSGNAEVVCKGDDEARGYLFFATPGRAANALSRAAADMARPPEGLQVTKVALVEMGTLKT